MTAQLPLRLARAAGFAAVCVALAALAHVLAGGPAPGVGAVAGGGTAVLLTALGMAGRERSPTTIGVTLGAAQFGLHELFGTATDYLPVHHGSTLGMSLGMLLAHAAATAVTGWWLARGESALWSLIRRLGARLIRVPALSVPPQVRQAHRPRPGWVPAPYELRHTVTRRGPPLPA
ncbi:MFS transporter [Nonomuraea sp. NPDC050310]|uniref:MFS transporter n=1 Tax=unclassified Nonomuraea TaxID=2593643 RepID=UPI0033F6020C